MRSGVWAARCAKAWTSECGSSKASVMECSCQCLGESRLTGPRDWRAVLGSRDVHRGTDGREKKLGPSGRPQRANAEAKVEAFHTAKLRTEMYENSLTFVFDNHYHYE
ncbi:hypothetical protein EMIT047CA2_60098 [Pseudomonas soli]